MVQNTGKHWSKRKHMEWVKLAATGIHVKWWKEDLSIYLIVYLAFFMTNPTGNYIFKVNIRNTRTSCEICSKLTIKTPEWRYWRRSGVFIGNFDHILHLVLVFILVTLSRQMPAGKVMKRLMADGPLC